MISFKQVSMRYGPQIIMKDASLQIQTGDHVGIVGPNGAGKSTLFSLICSSLVPDEGVIQLPKNCQLGHLRQQLYGHHDDVLLLDYTSRAIPELEQIDSDISNVEKQMSTSKGVEREKLVARLGVLMDRFEHLGGYELQTRAQEALGGLGFSEDTFEKPFGSFSGGWQMRAELARALISQPDILLLDEPSNYLDVPAVEWLQRFLKEYEGTLLLISHDRYLLRSLTSSILEIEQGLVTRYPVPYNRYVKEKEERRLQLIAAKKNQDRKREQIERFTERFRAKASRASQVQSRLKQLDKMEIIEVPQNSQSFSKIHMASPPHCGSEVIALEDAGLTYNQSHWVLRHVNLRILRGEKIAVVGFNGMGKTTLLRLLAGAHDVSEGKRGLGHQVIIGYQSQDFSETMPLEKTVYQIVHEANLEMPEQKVRSLLGRFGFPGEMVQKACKVLSGGERIRLAFARIFIQPPNFLILDEPTTHLDIQGRRALEQAVIDYEGAVCLVSHDIEFVSRVAQSIVSIAQGKATRFHGDYDYYREKVQEQERQSPKHSPNTSQQTSGHSSQTRKELSKQAVRKAKKMIDDLEKRIEKLEQKKIALAGGIATASFHEERQCIAEEVGAVEKELQSCMHKWAKVSDEIIEY
ncbi:MAG: ATP-binding cassette domain-containing protein [Kiritimatiellae bacterium]|nr:ATP-binding cassette domain-containing protein [Kiritimatiellia bacterium]